MAAQSCNLVRRGLTNLLTRSITSLSSSCTKHSPLFDVGTCSSYLGTCLVTNSSPYLSGQLYNVFSVRRKHSRKSSLDADELDERIRLAVRAAGSRKTGGGRPKVRRKRTVQWGPPAGTAGSEDLLEKDVMLREDQALGQVVTSQANYMRVLVEKSGAVTAGSPSATAGNAAPPAVAPREGSELLCVVRALLKKIRKRVLVGDRVLVSSIDWVEGRGMIEEVVKRKSQLEDPPIANCDHFLVLFALARPPLEPIQLSRFLVAAEHAGVPFTLALNKADLAPPGAAQAWKERLKGWGYNAHILSVEGGEGLEGVFKELRGKTTVVAGPSGAGKSSLINRLRKDSHRLAGRSEDDVSNGAAVSSDRGLEEGETFDTGMGKDDTLAVNTVSTKSGLGRHTTRSIVLIRLPLGGLLADTPGFSLPALSRITEQELPNCFPEVRQRLASAHAEDRHCAYKDCKHLAEPDCVVSGRKKKSDLDDNGSVMVIEGPDGSLEEREVFQMEDGFEPWERYEDYKQLMAEVKEREDKERWAYGTKKESAVRVRKTDGATGKPKVEPRLAPQKHRRESRKLAKQGLEGLLDEEALEDEEFREFMDQDSKEERETENEENGRVSGSALQSESGSSNGKADAFEGQGRHVHADAQSETEASADASLDASSGSTDEDPDDEDFNEWLKTRDFDYKWWEENDAHLQGDPRLAAGKSTKDVRRHWRLRQDKVLANREAVFGKKAPSE